MLKKCLVLLPPKKLEEIRCQITQFHERIEELSSDLKDQVREHFIAIDNELSVLWSLHVDESTDRNGKSHLLAFIRFINNETLVNEFLFCKELKGTTKGEDIFK